MDFGIASVAAITVIAYLVGIGCKAAGAVKDELIPVICGCVGAGLGIAGLYLMPDFPAKDVINALAVGIVSGGGDPRISAVPSVKGTRNYMALRVSQPGGLFR